VHLIPRNLELVPIDAIMVGLGAPKSDLPGIQNLAGHLKREEKLIPLIPPIVGTGTGLTTGIYACQVCLNPCWHWFVVGDLSPISGINSNHHSIYERSSLLQN
jgi:hypothetical protein